MANTGLPTLPTSALIPRRAPLALQSDNHTASGLPRLSAGQSVALAGITHDVRNLVTALKLCADLISEPGVFAGRHAHFAEEIASIARASDHIVRRLGAVARTATLAHDRSPVDTPIEDMGASLHELSALLAAVAGPAIAVQVACLPCAGPVRLSEENLTRILLNLVRNAADAMPAAGRIRITAQRGGGANFLWALGSGTDDTCSDIWEEPSDQAAIHTLIIAVEDDGPGIPADLLERVFEPGFSTCRTGQPWPESPHHGLGLSIVRNLVEQAGGTVRASLPTHRGTRIEIELPLTNVTPSLLSEPPAGSENGSY